MEPRGVSGAPKAGPQKRTKARSAAEEIKMSNVAFLGLGVMGYPMAGHLVKKGGHQVTVYNRTAAKAAQWVKEYGGASAPTPAEAAKDKDFVFACVGADNDVRAMTTAK